LKKKSREKGTTLQGKFPRLPRKSGYCRIEIKIQSMGGENSEFMERKGWRSGTFSAKEGHFVTQRMITSSEKYRGLFFMGGGTGEGVEQEGQEVENKIRSSTPKGTVGHWEREKRRLSQERRRKLLVRLKSKLQRGRDLKKGMRSKRQLRKGRFSKKGGSTGGEGG